MTKLLAERGQANNPLVGIFARLYARAMDMDAKLKQQATIPVAPKVNSQPPSSAFNGASVSNTNPGEEKVSMDEFNAVLNRR